MNKAEQLAKEYVAKENVDYGDLSHFAEIQIQSAFIAGWQANASHPRSDALEKQIVELLNVTGCKNILQVVGLFKAMKEGKSESELELIKQWPLSE